MDDAIGQIARWLVEAQRAVVFTGAGISTESGIRDFRSPGGVWATSQPVYFDDFLASAEARNEYWRQKAAAHPEFAQAEPNSAHRIIGQWEAAGIVRGVITQNIDGLHQQAGSQRVLELHGSARKVACLSCAKQWDADQWVEQFNETNLAPACPECSGHLKHATVSFGQSLPEDVLAEAGRLAAEADLFLVFGSSLAVYPAAGLPELAQQRGAHLVILNRTETPLDALAEIVLRGELGGLVEQIEQQRTELVHPS